MGAWRRLCLHGGTFPQQLLYFEAHYSLHGSDDRLSEEIERQHGDPQMPPLVSITPSLLFKEQDNGFRNMFEAFHVVAQEWAMSMYQLSESV